MASYWVAITFCLLVQMVTAKVNMNAEIQRVDHHLAGVRAKCESALSPNVPPEEGDSPTLNYRNLEHDFSDLP